MNLDANSAVLNSHICFNALATLHYIDDVEYYTATDNLSRSSVPHGLQVYEDSNGLHIISVQKFARGCRFGPFISPKSYIPVEPTRFPLIIFGTPSIHMDPMHSHELEELFRVHYTHLDMADEAKCNWMVHVEPANYANEQNLIAYEEDNQIFFAAIEDLDVGDILRVWYSPVYGERMQQLPLEHTDEPIVKNVATNGIHSTEYPLFDDFAVPPRQSEVMLPSIQTIIKPTSCIQYDARPIIRNGLHFSMVRKAAIVEDPVCLNLDENRTNASSLSDPSSYDSNDEQTDRFTKGAIEPVPNGGDVPGTDAKDDKRSFPCALCDKKYSTMTNIYRHVRAQHQCYLCSLCMNFYKCEDELKNHITICPKSNAKKPQCNVCMQYFANSWSLTRHVKIHISAGECNSDILGDRKPVKETRKIKPKCKDSPDIETGSTIDSPSLLLNALDSPAVYIGDASEMISPMELNDSANTTNGSIDGGGGAAPVAVENVEIDVERVHVRTEVTETKTDGPSPCIVCQKIFKSRSCLNKHLRNVHTVRVLTSVKRTSSSDRSVKTYSKRVHHNESQSSLTHIGAPVNPITAKALATKLNERHNQMNRVENRPEPVTLANDSPTKCGRTALTKVKVEPQQNGIKAELESNKNENGTLQKFNAAELTIEPLMPYRCNVCPRTFSKGKDLNRHKVTHENYYICTFCRKVVKTKQSLTKHLRHSHQDQKHIWDTAAYAAGLKSCTKPASKPKIVSPQKKLDTNYLLMEDYLRITGSDYTRCGTIKLEECYDADNCIESVGDSMELIDVDGDYQVVQYEHNGSSITSNEFTDPGNADNEAESNFTMPYMGETQPSLHHMIDDYFLVDDPLNCNAVLNSPFSSDQHDDDFKMSADDDKTMINNDLLNKFHDRLEEMEEKTESTSLTEIWNYMLVDEDHLTDDVCTGTAANAETVDENSTNFDFCTVDDANGNGNYPSYTTVK